MRKFLVGFMILALLAPITVMAQSQTYNSTSGLFSLEKDSYLSPIYWSEIERPVLFMQFGMPAASATAFDMGLGLPLSGMYAGANVNFYDYITGQVGGVSTRMTTDATFTYDTLGNRTSETRTTGYDYHIQSNKSNSLTGLFGMKIGDMMVSAYDYINIYDSSFKGYYGGVYTVPGTATWTAIATPVYQSGLAHQKSQVIVKDGAGTITSSTTKDFAAGTTGTASLTNNLRLGFTMPLGNMKLLTQTGVDLYDSNTASFGAFNYSIAKPLLAYADYTPGAAVILPDTTAAAIPDLQSYYFSAQRVGNDYTNITPHLNLGVEMPFELGYPGTLTAGLNSSWRFRARSNDYVDLAGVTQSLKGSANYSHNYLYSLGTPDALGRFTSTTTETRANDLWTYTSDMLQTYQPAGKLEVNPSDRFNFSISLSPTVTMQGNLSNRTSKATTIVTYFDNDGVNTGDADDYVETTTVERGSTSYEYQNFNLTTYIATGAQFYLVPDRFRVNLGGSFSNTMFNKTTENQLTDSTTTRTVTRQYGDATTALVTDYQVNLITAQQSISVSDTGSASVSYKVGVTYFFSDAMYLDLATNGGDIFTLNNWTLQLVIQY